MRYLGSTDRFPIILISRLLISKTRCWSNLKLFYIAHFSIDILLPQFLSMQKLDKVYKKVNAIFIKVSYYNNNNNTHLTNTLCRNKAKDFLLFVKTKNYYFF